MIFIYRDGKQYGPYAPEEIQRFIENGHVAETDYARTEHMQTWARVHDLLQRPAPTHSLSAPAASPPVATSVAHVAGPLPVRLPADVPSVEHKAREGNALTWPFYQENWMASLWMPLLWELPVFGSLLALGWSMDVIRRRATRRAEALPQSKDLGSMFLSGFVVFLAGGVYFVLVPFALGFLLRIPLFVVLWHRYQAGGWSEWLVSPWQAARLLVEQASLEWLLTVIVPLCILIGFPLFLAALVRFGITGRLRSFFNVFGNIWLLLRYLGDFLLFGFYVAVTLTVLGGVPFLIATVIQTAGLLSVALALPALALNLIFSAAPVTAGIWIIAYLAGTLSRDICDKGTVKPG